MLIVFFPSDTVVAFVQEFVKSKSTLYNCFLLLLRYTKDLFWEALFPVFLSSVLLKNTHENQ